MGPDDNSNIMLVVKYLDPTWDMLGMRLEMLSATQGTATMASVFDSYQEKILVDILSRDKGSALASKDSVVFLRV